MMTKPETPREEKKPVTNSLLELLLGAELVGVAALSLAAVGGTGRETSLESLTVSPRRSGEEKIPEGNVRSTCGRSSCRS